MKIEKSQVIVTGPLAIGGVGGSGTRLIARLLREAGLEMGRNLNRAEDCLSSAFLFGQPDSQAVSDEGFAQRFQFLEHSIVGSGLPGFAPDLLRRIISQTDESMTGVRPADWQENQAAMILQRKRARNARAPTAPWGWKGPTSHAVLDRLIAVSPTVKYIHVIRNGLDMAFSRNSRQLRIWGPHLFGLDGSDTSPANMLAYWARANRRAVKIGQTMGERFFLLSFDDFVANSAAELAKLFDFAEIDVTAPQRKELALMIENPASLARARGQDFSTFAKQDIDTVRDFGFDTYGA